MGKALQGGLLKGESLTLQRLATKNSSEGNLLLKIEPDFSGDVLTNDNVRVYVELINPDTKGTSVKVLYDHKKVQKVTTPDNMILSTPKEGIKNPNFHINVTEDELKEYYVAKQAGFIIVSKLNSLDIKELKSDPTLKFDENSSDVKNSSKDKLASSSTDKGLAVMSYQMQQGDTIDSLSLKFKTSKETIESLNGGQSSFKAGDNLTVPAV